VAAAEKLCPRGGKIETEPGNGLPKAYFGRDYGDRWKAMISKRQIIPIAENQKGRFASGNVDNVPVTAVL